MITARTDNSVAFAGGAQRFVFNGLSTDTKPVGDYSGTPIANTSIWQDIDGGAISMYDADSDTWKQW